MDDLSYSRYSVYFFCDFMTLKCGLVGLPNVGKSTLFNAITRTQAAQAANYPFCTIEPNVGNVAIPDLRLDKLAKLANSKSVIYNQLSLVDIAGLVKGASAGEGLGNQFLANIREVDAIIHVVRCFEDADVSHVNNTIDPINDISLIETELILSDIQALEKRVKKKKDEDAILVKKVLDDLINDKTIDPKDGKYLGLLSTKPVLYVCNVDDISASSGNSFSKEVELYAESKGCFAVVISAKIESEISSFEEEADRRDFLQDVGLNEPGLDLIVRKGYSLLGLLTFFTVGEKEARAWSLKRGLLAPEAAGVIHSDFERGFIKAETISYDDYIDYGGESGCKSAGKMRMEGKLYEVMDGDIFNFKFNV